MSSVEAYVILGMDLSWKEDDYSQELCTFIDESGYVEKRYSGNGDCQFVGKQLYMFDECSSVNFRDMVKKVSETEQTYTEEVKKNLQDFFQYLRENENEIEDKQELSQFINDNSIFITHMQPLIIWGSS